MRAQMDHTKLFSPEEVYIGNLMGGNSGNWLYQFSLFRALLKDESVTIDTVDTKFANKGGQKQLSEKYASFVNENYDCFVLPLANAFRNGFVEELNELTSFIKKLKIPCVVPGIGIQILNGKDFCNDFKFRDESKAFVSAVLDKSSMIGLRGEETAKFLSSLGFARDKDFTVIGCPSMYTFGSKLPETKPLTFDSNSLVLLNSKVEHENKKVLSMFRSFTAEHENYIYVPQRRAHIITSYYGTYFQPCDDKFVYADRFYDSAKTATFTSVPEWYGFVNRNVDLSLGTRIHGSVAAILGGAPTFIINLDRRVGELAQYHNIAHTSFDKIKPGATIESIIENVDFGCVHHGHEERFNHFVDFLEKNGLQTAYSADRNVKEVYFDSLLKKNDYQFDSKAFDACNEEEKINRTRKAAVFFAYEANDLKKEVAAANKKAASLKKKQRKNEKQLTFKELLKLLFKKIFKTSSKKRANNSALFLGAHIKQAAKRKSFAAAVFVTCF